MRKVPKIKNNEPMGQEQRTVLFLDEVDKYLTEVEKDMKAFDKRLTNLEKKNV